MGDVKFDEEIEISKNLVGPNDHNKSSSLLILDRLNKGGNCSILFRKMN